VPRTFGSESRRGVETPIEVMGLKLSVAGRSPA
jgi:hypothetical protein